MKIKLLVFALFALLCAVLFYNKEPVPASELHYICREPKVKTDNPPVVILLHGIFGNENNLFSFADKLPDRFLIISVRAPYRIEEGKYRWFRADFTKAKPVYEKKEAEVSRALIIGFIDQLGQKYSFDKNQVYLCGFSQGAMMAYSAGITAPDKIKGIAMIGGLLLDDVKPRIAPKDKLSPLNTFIAHGTQDQVIKINHAIEACFFLQQKGLHPEYHEYHEGHTVSDAMLTDLVKWLSTEYE